VPPLLQEKKIQNLNEILIFASVVEQGGVRPAAEKLRIAKSKVSRALATLEQELGVRLLERTTRAVHVTDIGKVYYSHCRAALDALEHARADVQNRQGKPQGSLRVTAAAVLGKYLLEPVIAEFIAEYPDVKIVADVSDRVVDVVEEGYDVAIRLGSSQPSSLVTRCLGLPQAGLYASANYLARQGAPAEPQMLAGHRTLALGNVDQPTQWRLKRSGHSHFVSIDLDPVLKTNSAGLLMKCAMEGGGIGLVPHFMCQAEDLRNKLVMVLPQWLGEAIAVRAVVASHKGISPTIRAFIETAARVGAAIFNGDDAAGAE
jgi:DNA-binding transcriptional LysR family regulator